MKIKLNITNLFLILLLIFISKLELKSQTYQTWRGEATSNSWQGETNWWNFPNPSPFVFGQQEWDNNHELSQTSGVNVSTWRFLFKLGASSVHTFSGNTISFFDFGGQDPSITNQSSAVHVINNAINGDDAGDDPLIIDIQNSGLTFGGTINLNSNNLNIQGSTSSSTAVTFNNVISGSGGLYKANNNITVHFNNANTYSGQTTIDAGTIEVGVGGSLGSGDVRIASLGSLVLKDNSTVTSVAEKGTGNGGGISIHVGKTLTINGHNKGTLYQNSISGEGNLTMSGTGNTILALYGTQSYSGATTINSGTLQSSVNISSSNILINNGGTFEAVTNTLSLGGLTVNNGGTLKYSSGGSVSIAESATEPTTPTTSVSLEFLTVTSIRIGWTNGNGSKRIIILKQGSDVDFDPVDGVLLSANSVYGSGAQLGSGNYIVYNGTGATTVDVTGLTNGETYYVKIYEYNESSSLPDYKQSSPGSANMNLPVQLSSFNASVINKSVNLKWQTATEQNNYGFEVERTSNNDWIKIGFVNGSGNSNSPKEYSFTDNSLNNSGKYSYRLKQLDNDGSYEYSSIVEVDYNPVLAFELEQNYPNPFNPVTSISYSVVNEGLVKIEIYNSLGQLVAIPVNEIKSSGRYSVSFDASKMSSGTYIYKLSAGEFVQTKKMNLIK